MGETIWGKKLDRLQILGKNWTGDKNVLRTGDKNVLMTGDPLSGPSLYRPGPCTAVAFNNIILANC